MQRISRFALIVTVGLFALACGGGSGSNETDTQPGTDVVADAAADTTVDAATASCEKCGNIEGLAMRFTSLYVTEPDSPDSETDGAVRDFLNEIWGRDVSLDLLNILFVITKYDPVAGVLEADVGPAWKFPDGKFHFICDDTASSIGYAKHYVTTFDPGTCGYQNDAATSGELFFHTGPKNDPIICSPDVPKVNAIPMYGLLTHGVLETDCAAGTASITGGYLQGWITEWAADRICSCNGFDENTKKYNCKHDANPNSTLNYCFQNCGSGYTLFGKVVKDTAKVAPQPGPDGEPAFRLAGVYSTQTIANYSPVCCGSDTDPNCQ